MVALAGKLHLFFCIYIAVLVDSLVTSNHRNVELNSFVTSRKYDDSWIDWRTLRFTKVAPNQFAINGDVEAKRNFGDEQYVEIKVFHSNERTKNNNSVIYYVKKSICKYIATDTKLYPNLQKHSNLPEKGVCPCPKGLYTIRNYNFEAKNIPPVIPNGEFKVIVLFYDNEKPVAGLEAEVTISNS